MPHRDDQDSGTTASHHTLGTRIYQASPGNHQHRYKQDDPNSPLLSDGSLPLFLEETTIKGQAKYLELTGSYYITETAITALINILKGFGLVDKTTKLPHSDSGGGGGVTDHGQLTGLGDDDHTQYLNNARGDARYPPVGRSLNAGAGLTGGGTLAADRTINVGSGQGIIVTADAIQIDKALLDGWYSGGGAGTDEVWIDPIQPTDPGIELWVDPDDNSSFAVDKTYTHTQATMSAVWTITHNLAKRPAVAAQDAAGAVIYGTIQHINSNTLTITFKNAVTGRADCN